MSSQASRAVLISAPGDVALDSSELSETRALGSGLSLAATSGEVDVSALRNRHKTPVEGSDDRVIRSLSFALEAAEQGRDRYCIETLRHAIAIRLTSLQSTLREDDAAVERQPSGRRIQALQKWRLKRVVDYIDDHLADKISLQDLAAVSGLSRMHFASKFRVATGLRPHEFLLRRRIRRAEELLQNGTMTIVEIALNVGFQTQAHFTTVFKRFVGHTPRQWRAASQPPSVAPARPHAPSGMATAI
jgi:AraC family transcriptional regulator